MPGGWSAKGQPCDQFHHVLRALIDQEMDIRLGFNGSLLKRLPYHELPLNASGVHKLAANVKMCVDAVVVA